MQLLSSEIRMLDGRDLFPQSRIHHEIQNVMLMPDLEPIMSTTNSESESMQERESERERAQPMNGLKLL